MKFTGRRKIKYLTRRIDFLAAQENFYFSEDFNVLYLSDEDSKILIELHFQGRNFYVKNLSLKTSVGNELHDALILTLNSKYLSYAELIKFGAREQVSAAKNCSTECMRCTPLRHKFLPRDRKVIHGSERIGDLRREGPLQQVKWA